MAALNEWIYIQAISGCYAVSVHYEVYIVG